jgi:predicted NAD/FAD-dependent oxidoreductase
MQKRKHSIPLTRREFLAVGSAALVGLGLKTDRPIAGSFVNESFQLGHMLRDRNPFPKPTKTEKFPVVIVGGGMAGLSAAWQLERHGFRDFVLLEMDKQPGGNSRWGENEITAYPWAAHYVPVPNAKATLVRELFEEFGALKDGKWEERYLCFTPQERLFIHGRWQEGIEPAVGLTDRDREQFKRFDDHMQQFRASKSFTIPTQLGIDSSHSPEIAKLDRISIAEWMQQQKFDSSYLRWYVDYACRDDYGAPAASTSAWAGVHYYASREHEEKGPLTWPEGNGWIARRLIQKLDRNIRPQAMVHRIAKDKNRNRYSVLAGDTEFIADAVIFAAPTFLAPYLIEGMPPALTKDFVYSPWLTANITVDRLPHEVHNSETAWDNVIYDSPSLGYVVANHQSIRQHEERSVWTYYWALAEKSPADARRYLLDKDWAYWRDAILADLSRIHPDIRDCVSRIDVMRMGHAMIRPSVGFIFSENRKTLARSQSALERLFFANSDLSGISIFEEAQYRGVTAATRAMAAVGGR